MSNKKKWHSFSGKGYYIALILCAVAIGISGYLYYRNASNDQPQLNNPTQDALNPTDDDMQAVATDPTGGANNGGEQKPTEGKKPLKTQSPVSGETVLGYAMDCLCYNPTTRDWRVHNGIDISAPEGTAVNAAAEGTVYTVYSDDTMGTTVVIRHQDGYVTTYSSLAADVTVSVGDEVAMGQAIGTVGNTALLETALGEHVHFSVTCNDVPMDPAAFLSLS